MSYVYCLKQRVQYLPYLPKIDTECAQPLLAGDSSGATFEGSNK
jgi:hypothetical protein